MTPRKTNELGSSLSAPVPWKYIGPEANCEAKRAFAPKNQRLRKKSWAIRCRRCLALLIESPAGTELYTLAVAPET
jgi:hypothetical protein